ncbi:MAG: hypothetical protein HGA96_12150 [Desulfobulbaceae bacterium]|nr:hypothetical protein [Desulfobulbaceae bacterium]
MTTSPRHERNGRRPARVVALIALCLLCLPAISASVDETRFAAYVEQHATGWIDWQNGLIYGIGRGYLNKNGNNRPLSQGVGGVLASGNIVKLAAGMHLDDTHTLESLGRGKVTINLKAFVRDKQFKSTYVENGDDPYYEIVKVADMKGITGLTAKLLDHFNKEQDWQDLPVRNLEPRADLGDEDEPWLLIDARNLGNRPQPALFPKIKSTAGAEVYDVKQVEEAALINRGMMSYVTTSASTEELRSDARLVDRLLASAGLLVGVNEAQAKTELRSLGIPVIAAPAGEAEVEPARPGGRQKRGRYIVKNAKDVQGLAKTNLVISAEDALELQAEDANSQILKKCRVVVVVSSPIGGIEGALPGDQLALLAPAS